MFELDSSKRLYKDAHDHIRSRNVVQINVIEGVEENDSHESESYVIMFFFFLISYLYILSAVLRACHLYVASNLVFVKLYL